MNDPRVDKLYQILDALPNLMVAYSGGVDSTCLLYAAAQRLHERALGVIADTPSLPRAELAAALELAKKIGANVEVIHPTEFENPDFLKNSEQRCYFCKREMFELMQALAHQRGFFALAYGENADDIGEVRPGALAAMECQIRAPLMEANLGKADIRELCEMWGLPIADKPSSPCLTSRIPFGTPITMEALAKIEAGEAAIRAMGFRVFRLRHHGAKARLEFSPDELEKAFSDEFNSKIIFAVKAAGYTEVEIDPRGYRSQSGLR
jgi:uncharacterized protein